LTSPYAFEPIGVVRSPFRERASAPRQPTADLTGSTNTGGTIELFAGRGYGDALDGLADWEYAWVLFVFHRNVEDGRGWKPKVQPPRSDTKRGVFATRSPHRPNPIGLSAVKIERIDGLVIHVRHLDILDGTPVLDLKPYVAYADAYPDARAGWLGIRDPIAPWEVVFADAAVEQLAWLRKNGVDLRPAIEGALTLGPRPHAYRRIRRHGTGMRLALKEWRVDFEVPEAGEQTGQCIVVAAVLSGYRAKQLAEDPSLGLHRAYAGRFTTGGAYPAD
jgi:tRNA-Thr(GGU) m(6)t(6)A37 methyltransferase TsaA